MDTRTRILNTLREAETPPSIRQIAEEVGVQSKATVHYHLRHLEREGLAKKVQTKVVREAWVAA